MRDGHAMVYLDRIRMLTCDQPAENLLDSGEELTGGKDDRVFWLDRVDDARCGKNETVGERRRGP
jgi:hypothetical protein